MKKPIYTIFDRAVEAYARPFQGETDGEAIRMFEDEAFNESSPVSKHPEDYALFRVGFFNVSTGEITSEATPVCLSRAHEVKAKVTALKEAQ